MTGSGFPNFALSLSVDGIRLLKRVDGGWHLIGVVDLGSDDLDGELAALKRRGEALAGGPLRTKLLLPGDQVRYLSIEGIADEAEVRAALNGATPYELDALAFDWTDFAGRTFIAAVARETLLEAETFATDYGFGPVSFATQPEPFSFDGEPFFGLTSVADTLLTNGQTVERDSEPVHVIGALEDPVHHDDDPWEPLQDTETAAESEKPAAAVDPIPTEAEAEAPADENDEQSQVAEREAVETPADEPAAASTPVSSDESGPDDDMASEDIDEPAPVAALVAVGADETAQADRDPPLRGKAAEPAATDTVDVSVVEAETATETAPAADEAPAPGEAALDAIEPQQPSAPARRFRPLMADIRPAADQSKADAPSFSSRRRDAAVRDEPPLFKSTTALTRSQPEEPPLNSTRDDAPDPEQVAATLSPAREGMPPSLGGAQRESALPEPKTSAITTKETAPVETAPAITGISDAALPIEDTPEAEPPATDDALAAAPAPTTFPKVLSAQREAAALAARDLRPQMPPAAQNEADRMTVFGARKHAAPAKTGTGGKPRFLGVILTAILLVFLVTVAAMAAIFSEDGLAAWFGGGNDDASEIASSTPAPVAETMAEPDLIAAVAAAAQAVQPDDDSAGIEVAEDSDPLPDALPDPLPTAEADPDTVPDTEPTIPELRTDRPPQVLSPAEARRIYAATGVWQKAPSEPVAPFERRVDGLYLTAIDPDVTVIDAFALPELNLLDGSSAPPVTVDPPAPGTQFDIDENGMVLAVPDGTVTPRGVMVYAAPPPVEPPLRPSRAPGLAEPEVVPDAEETPQTDLASNVAAEAEIEPEPQAEAEAEAGEPAPGAVAIDGLRPSTRPSNLVEQKERATLNGRSVEELAGLRPLTRPDELRPAEPATEETASDEPPELPDVQQADAAAIAAAVAQAGAATTPEALPPRPQVNITANAVARSLRPDRRPQNFARVVDRARTATTQQRQAATQAPRTVAPSGQTATTVAQAATQDNSINLRQINLIGVYGRPNDRRALVRLSNGRYVKVRAGDRLDGGQVAAIGDDALRYVKNGRNIVLEIPSS